MKCFTILLFFTVLLSACAKTPQESATDAAMAQIGAVEHTIKKECPDAKIDKDMDALRASVQSQLATCESQISVERAKRRTWQVASFALMGLVAILLYIKILRI